MFTYTPEIGVHTFRDTFKELDSHSFSWVSFSFLWTHKNLILFPLDVVFDCLQAKSHFENDNIWWCYLTILLICLPNVLCLLNLVFKSLGKPSSSQTQKEKASHRIINAMFHFFFLHFITLYR